MKRRRTLRQYANQLRKELPTGYRVSVRVVEMPKGGEENERHRDFADTKFDGGRHYIRVNRAFSKPVQKDCLEHEWAHCMVPWDDECEHSDEWGRAYARVLRVTTGWEDLS